MAYVDLTSWRLKFPYCRYAKKKKPRIHKEYEALVLIEIVIAEEEGFEPPKLTLDYQLIKFFLVPKLPNR